MKDFYQKEQKNSIERKIIILSYGDTDEHGKKKEIEERNTLAVSKVNIDQSEQYSKIQESQGMLAYLTKILCNHVFDPETGESWLNPVDILHESGCRTVEQFVNDKLPLELVLEIQTAIEHFSGITSRQERIEKLKN